MYSVQIRALISPLKKCIEDIELDLGITYLSL